MADDRVHRAYGLAWLFLCLHLAAHVVEEAATGFVDVWNPVLAAAGERAGVAAPQLVFGPWLTALIMAIAVLFALTPLAYRGVAWLVPVSVALALLMIANGINHLLSPLYLGRFLPGQYTSPLLIVSSVWVLVQARRVRGHTARVPPLVGSLAFFVAAPMTVAGWIPYAISDWAFSPPLLGLSVGRVLGAAMAIAGTMTLLECFVRFALHGRGTPAAMAPPEVLVVSGLYRYTRNPMYSAVVSVIAGQALFFGNLALLGYGAVVWLLAHVFVVWCEEPGLRREFGPQYDAYRTQVPRWLLRLHPWTPVTAGEAR